MKEHHFKDDNGKEITPITQQRGAVTIVLNSIMTLWTGQSDEKF